MKQQRILFYIAAKRARPDIVPKVAAWQELARWKNDPEIFISFTYVDKIGVNPRTSYETPIGIYTYPLQAIWKEYNIDGTDFSFHRDFNEIVPFAGSAPFIQVLRIVSDKILDVDKYTDENMKRDARQLAALFPDVDLNRYWQAAKNNTLVSQPIGFFWYVLWELSKDQAAQEGSRSKAPVRWNKILRQLGYDVVVDRGKGIIHRNEKIQAVFLTRQAFKQVTTLRNVNPTNSLSTSVAPKVQPLLRREIGKLKTLEGLKAKLRDCWNRLNSNDQNEFLYELKSADSDRQIVVIREILLGYWGLATREQADILSKMSAQRRSFQVLPYAPISFLKWLWCEAGVPAALQNSEAFQAYLNTYSKRVEAALEAVIEKYAKELVAVIKK